MALCCHIKRRSNGNVADCRALGRPSESWSVVGGAAGIFARPGFEPPTKKCVVSCITIRPLLVLSQEFSALLGAASATDKKPKLFVSV